MTADCSINADSTIASVSSETVANGTSGRFSASALSIRAQKKIASKLSTRSVTKKFIPPTADRLFEHIFEVLKLEFPKKEAEKVVSNMIKLAVKLGLLSLNNLLQPSELVLLDKVQLRLHSLAMTFVSFEKVAFSYERAYLVQLIEGLREMLLPLLESHLSDKSSKRLEHVISHLTNGEMLDALFKVNGPQTALLRSISSDLEQMVDQSLI